MRKIKLGILIFLSAIFCGTLAQKSNISQLEYFFDIDPGFGSAIPVAIAPDSLIDTTFAIDLSGVPDGIHTIYFRVKNDSGWSITYNKPLLIVHTKNYPKLDKIEYFFNSDSGYEFGEIIDLTLHDSSKIDTSFFIPLNTLSSGINTLYFRLQDDNGIWSQTYMKPLLVTESGGVSNIDKIEYFFDTDPGYGMGNELELVPIILLDTVYKIPIDSISPGMHQLYIRAKNETKNWSLVFTKPVFVTQSGELSILTNLEYFFDADPGFGNGILVDLSYQNVSYIDTIIKINLDTITPGMHQLYLRAQDELENWSTVFSKPIFVSQSGELSILTNLEYFFDIDPGFGNGNLIDLSIHNNFYIDTLIKIGLDSVSTGMHQLYVRAENENGNWSTINTKPIFVTQTSTLVNISKIEYFFDNDPGFGNGYELSLTPDVFIDEFYNLPVDTISNGFHVMYIRAQDENGIWSFNYTKPFIKIEIEETPKIIEVEYFLDTDPGFGNGINIAINPNEIIDTVIEIPADSTFEDYTYHNLFMRAKDEKGNWSLTNYKEFLYRKLIQQNISLSVGWNIISFYIEPLDTTMISIVQPLIDDSVLVKMQGETGAAIEIIDDSLINNIELAVSTEGYKIKVSQDTVLTVDGYKIILPLETDLQQGWNIMSYPSDNSQPVNVALTHLVNDDNLAKVQDETGAAYEYIFPIGWIDNINTFEPGEGYKIKVYSNTSIIFEQNYLKSSSLPGISYDDGIRHFNPSWIGNGIDHMNIYISAINMNGKNLEFGDEIAIYDGEICVGISKIIDITQTYIPVFATYDDLETKEKDGFENGNNILFKIWDASEGMEISNIQAKFINGYPNQFEKQASTVVELMPQTNSTNTVTHDFYNELGNNYPNPFTKETNIEFIISNEGFVELEIIDIMGNIVCTLIQENLAAGYHTISWNRTDARSNKVPAGVYFYKLTTNDFSSIKTMVIK